MGTKWMEHWYKWATLEKRGCKHNIETDAA